MKLNTKICKMLLFGNARLKHKCAAWAIALPYILQCLPEEVYNIDMFLIKDSELNSFSSWFPSPAQSYCLVPPRHLPAPHLPRVWYNRQAEIMHACNRQKSQGLFKPKHRSKNPERLQNLARSSSQPLEPHKTVWVLPGRAEVISNRFVCGRGW